MGRRRWPGDRGGGGAGDRARGRHALRRRRPVGRAARDARALRWRRCTTCVTRRRRSPPARSSRWWPCCRRRRHRHEHGGVLVGGPAGAHAVPGAETGDLVLIEPRTDSGGYPGDVVAGAADSAASAARHRRPRRRRPRAGSASAIRAGGAGVAQLVSDGLFETLRLPGGRSAARWRRRQRRARRCSVRWPWCRRFLAHAPRRRRGRHGRRLRVNGVELTIVGVAPDRFQGTVVGIDVSAVGAGGVLPSRCSRRSRDLDIGAPRLLGDGPAGARHTRAAAQAELRAAMATLARDRPDTQRRARAEALAFSDAPRGGRPARAGAGCAAVAAPAVPRRRLRQPRQPAAGARRRSAARAGGAAGPRRRARRHAARARPGSRCCWPRRAPCCGVTLRPRAPRRCAPCAVR